MLVQGRVGSCSDSVGGCSDRVARVTKNVWYRSSVGTGIEDRGTVTLYDGTFAFTGKKQTVSGRVRSAQRRPMGFKSWVHVSYDAAGEARDAYFLVKDMLGWAGMLGANRQLLEAFQAATAPSEQGAADG